MSVAVCVGLMQCREMFGFKRKPVVPAPIPAEVPPGCVVWAVGDIHGRLDLLNSLLDGIQSDLDRSTAQRKVIICLGDYVDRGPDSLRVIERLCQLADEGRVETHFLRGNHEDKMIEFLMDPNAGPEWCRYGGIEALASFGLKPPVLSHRMDSWISLSADLGHLLSDRHRRFLDELKTSVSIGGYFFAHAGARPGVPLDAQDASDLMWIRTRFLKDAGRFEKIIVHGHSRTPAIHVDERRIGIDTGAYESGILSALRLEGFQRHALQAAEVDGEIRTGPLRPL